MGNVVKGFTKAQTNNTHSFSLIHSADYPVIEGDQACQAGPSFPKPMLAGPNSLVALYMLHDGPQGDLLHELPQH